jgi:DNA polymerase-3 subunit alpha
MSAVGITDYGNMMGAFSFLKTIETYNQSIINTLHKPLKGIIGCELFLSENPSKKKKKKKVIKR